MPNKKTIENLKIEFSNDFDYFKTVDVISASDAQEMLNVAQSKETVKLVANLLSKMWGPLTARLQMSKNELIDFLAFNFDRSHLQTKQMTELCSTGKPISIEYNLYPPKITYISGSKRATSKCDGPLKTSLEQLFSEMRQLISSQPLNK